MREINFRAKRIDNGEWVTGHYTEGSPDFHYITRNNGSVWQVDPETLGQFTGMKDSKKSDMYEGDIVECHMKYEDGTLPHQGEIVYYDIACAFATQNSIGAITVIYPHLNSFTVIGNATDNKELLK